MSEHGVQQRPLEATLTELQRICDSLAHHHQPAARDLASIIWRLHCSSRSWNKRRRRGRLGIRSPRRHSVPHHHQAVSADRTYCRRRRGSLAPCLSPHPAFEAWRNNRIRGFAVIIYHQHGQIAQMAHSVRALMLTGMLWVKVAACRLCCRGFTLFNAG